MKDEKIKEQFELWHSKMLKEYGYTTESYGPHTKHKDFKAYKATIEMWEDSKSRETEKLKRLLAETVKINGCDWCGKNDERSEHLKGCEVGEALK